MKKSMRIKIACLGVAFLLAMSSFGVLFTKVKAAAIPAGGGEIDSAVAISAGTYSVGAIAEKENKYYSISVKAGQELVVTGTFKVVTENETYGTLDTIEIYNDTKDSIASAYDTAPALITVAALADSSKSTHTYYIRISDDTWGTESGELTVVLNDRYDASSGTDAGASFDTALATTAGTITGYLSKVDSDDYYSISATKGSVSAKITPDKEASPEVKIFDANRKELVSEVASNGGEIMTASADISADQKVYIQVKCDINMGCTDKASQYSLVISGGTATGITEPEIPGTLIDFPGIVPITPTGDAAKIDAIVKPPLDKIFDNNVKAKEVSKDRIVYVVSRETTANDLTAIQAAMTALGYKTKSITSDTLIMRKGFKEIKFERKAGSNQIVVTQKSIISLLWIGIIAGGLLLIIIIVVIIVVSSKKKPGATPATSQASTPPASPPAPSAPPAPEVKK